MIDRLVLRCEFTDLDRFDLRRLPIPLEGALEADGRLYAVRHPWERIPSSFEPVAFKVYDFTNAKEPRAFIELKASPAKVMQGHNVYGTDDLQACALALCEAFFKHYPDVADLLDPHSWEVREADITYHSRAESPIHANAFIQAASRIQKGQTKSRSGYASTTYFGNKKSRLKKVKLYEKSQEIREHLKKLSKEKDGELRAEPFTPELIKYSEGLIRWEVTLKARWFTRRKISIRLKDMVKTWSPVRYWKEATKDIRDAIKGQTMKMTNDEKIEKALKAKYESTTKTGKKSYTKAINCFRTYLVIKDRGYQEAMRVSVRRTFYEHLEMLHAIGLSRAALQNVEYGNNIIPMVRYIEVEFSDQYPAWSDLAKTGTG